MSSIRVLIADDHAIFREGLYALLKYYKDIKVVGEAQDGEEAILRVGELQPDIVLMDIAMPNLNGLEATRKICREYPATRVLILTQHEAPQYILPLIKAGASGYILKRAARKELIEALRAVSRGETFLSSVVAATVMEEIRGQRDRAATKPEALTAREHEILQYIVTGKTSSQIAGILSISVKTVEWHRTNLMSKLGIHNIAGLVRYAFEKGLVDGMTMASFSSKRYS